MQDDAAHWDGRYRGHRTGVPTAPDRLPDVGLPSSGRCLDVACGLGAQSLWAATLGFEVVALDVSPVAIDALVGAAQLFGVGHQVDARVVDLDQGLPDGIAGTFDLVICQRFRAVGLYPHLAAALAPGGVVVVTVLSSVGLDDEPGAFHAPPGELVCAFRDFDVDVIRSVEQHGEATLVARRTSPS
jgi:SAM-dependent methyltransferase